MLTAVLVLLSSVAFAKGGKPTPQNHSCVLNDAVVQKTKKECVKAGGKWEKNSNLPKADAATPAPAPTPTPAPAPAPPAPTPEAPK